MEIEREGGGRENGVGRREGGGVIEGESERKRERE